MGEYQHEHKYRKQVVNRLARIEGHVRSIKEMTQNGRDCLDILLHIAGLRKALDNTAKVIFSDNMESCLVNAVHEGNEEEVIKKIKKALDHFIR